MALGLLGLQQQDHRDWFGRGHSAGHSGKIQALRHVAQAHMWFQQYTVHVYSSKKRRGCCRSCVRPPARQSCSWAVPLTWGLPGWRGACELPGERCARARRPTETPGDGNDNVLLSLPVFFACLLKHGARVSATDLTSPLQSGPSVSVRRARDAWLEQSHALPPGNTFV